VTLSEVTFLKYLCPIIDRGSKSIWHC